MDYATCHQNYAHQFHNLVSFKRFNLVSFFSTTVGSLFLFNKRVMRFFRRDGHNWHKKKDERTVGEAHERLKVGTIEALNCYYAHGEQNPTFQRRSYWMLDLAYEHIILVHYRTTSELKNFVGSRQKGSRNFHLSSFVVSLAYAWVCKVKAKETKSKKVGMAINVDCRN
ncbi:hypothetical protein HN51_062135 [Arachis hypogaea]